MKRVTTSFLFLVPLIGGCASQPGPEEPDLDRLQQELVIDVLKTKLRQNGAYILCDQPAYLACYDMSKHQCVLEVSKNNERCIQKADARFSELTYENREKYGAYYAGCIAIHHGMMHHDKVHAVAQCLDNASIDKEIAEKSLLR